MDLNQMPLNNVKSISIKDTAAGEGAQRVVGGHHPVLPDRRRGLRPHLRHLPREGISGTGPGQRVGTRLRESKFAFYCLKRMRRT